MAIRLHNDLTGKKEELRTIKPGVVTFYLCGPTVYDSPHVGNWRTFVSFDMVHRYLRYRGFNVNFVQNITDIEDKMINRAHERGISVAQLADRYTAVFVEGQNDLNVLPPTHMPKATEHIPEITGIIERLIFKGLAYEAGGDVYFSIQNYTNYGQLTRQSLEEMQAGARVEVDERKRHPMDFALWKSQKPGEPAWDSPWGSGRPGWHIECSAMAMKYLGETIDIHAGGIDLLFPHHENEIAQSEGATGQPFANYWMHGAFLNLEGEKMSKSLGNVLNLDALKQSYHPEVLRFFYISAHYRSPLNYSRDNLDGAKAGLERLYNIRAALEHQIEAGSQTAPDGDRSREESFRANLGQYRQRFTGYMDDDFNSAGAVSVLFDLTRDANPLVSAGVSRELARELLDLYDELGGRVLGLFYQNRPADPLEAEIEKLIAERQQARQEKNWARSDQIRDQLKARGIILEDTPQGVRWKRQ